MAHSFLTVQSKRGWPGMGGRDQEHRPQAVARVRLSTPSQYRILETRVDFAKDHIASDQWGWLTEIPSDDKGAGCSPLTTKHKEGQLIALIKRGGCDYVDKATTGRTKMSIIYNNKEEERLTTMGGFGKYENKLGFLN